ncbi:MAG: ABC transporter permease [Peptococcaceae bacterium]|nr:ABC transporter permease [Peptococcaceae bacterium]
MFIKKLLRSSNAALLFITIAVTLLFYIFNNNYLNFDNVRNILNSMSFVGVLSVGMTLLLIGGEVDLAAGAEACFSGVVVALLINAGVPWGLAFFLTVLFGALCGLINAFFINKLGFMSFIATLGMMSVYQGLVTVITQSKNIQIPEQGFWVIGSISLWNVVPLAFIIMLVLMIAYSVVLSNTNFGRSVYMCGGNRHAARLCGINPKKISTILYVNNGVLAAIAGVVLTSRMHTASPAAGSSGAIDAITAAVLGGVSFLGGAGGMSGCFIGILLLNVFNAGLTAVGFPSYWQIVARGGLLVLALCLDFIGARSRRLALERE